MELYIGGYAQGKRAYVQKKYEISPEYIFDGESVEFEADISCGGGQRVVLDHFHLWLKRKLAEGADLEAMALTLVERTEDCIVICDEIGNGIVPMDATEREWRERTGRILCMLAAQAEHVERIICGIGEIIK